MQNSFCVVNVLFAQPVTLNKPKQNAPLLISLTSSSLCTEAKTPSYILVAATEWKTRQLLQCSDGNLASVLPLPSQLHASAQGFHLLWYGGRLTIEHVLAKLGKME